MTGQISPHGSGRCSRIRRSPRPRSRISMPSIEKPAPVPGNHRNVMRRRTFLATAAATTALPVLAACTHQTRQPNRPAPTPPPGPDSVPTSFADRPTWPTAGTTDTDTVITAAHDRYLCGGARIKEALDVITGGWCPVVVDVGTLTTHAVLLDENGSWTTKEAETAGLHSMGKDPRTALTTIMMGPALLDDEYAYLTMGALILSSPSTEDPSSYDHPPEGTTCPVVVAKVRLSDASIMNVATVAEKYSTKNVESINLSFSADRSSLIMTGKGDQSPTTQPPENYIALRLSAADLSVELDARSILENQYVTYIRSYGQAIGYHPATASTSSILFLSNGEHESTGGAVPTIVRDDWYYYRDDTTDEQGLARNVSSGQTVVLKGDWENEVEWWPTISSDQQASLAFNHQRGSAPYLSVRLPGASAPALKWTENERRVPDGACVVGDILYSSYDLDDSGSTTTDHLDLTSISTGEEITQTEGETGLAGECNNVITPWGLATYGAFYSATAWLDASITAEPESPDASATSTAS